MKTIIFVLVLGALITVVSGQTSSTCTICGDPHWHTLDGVCYDFQGQGLYQQLLSKLVEIQTLFQKCNPNVMVTCIRSATVQLRTPADDYLSVNVQWGAWYNYTTRVYTYDALIIDGEVTDPATCTTAAGGCVLSYELGTVYYDASSKRVTISSALSGASVVLGLYYMAVNIPMTDTFLGQTYGLCGFFDGDATDEFTSLNGTLYYPSAPHTHVSNPAINAWASTFAVDGVNILPLAGDFSMFDNGHMATPPIIIPNAEQTAAMIPITFDNFQQMEEIQTMCLSIDTTATLDSMATKNCIYDALALSDNLQLAASNHFGQMAARSLQQSNSSGSSKPLSDNAIIGISVGIGLTAMLAVAVSYILHVRVKRATQAYQNALVALCQDDSDPRMTL